MFKYIKTIGAHCGAPETERMPISKTASMPEGCLCELQAGALTSSVSAGKAKFITIEKKEADDGKNKIKCIRVLPGMLIKVEYTGDIDNATVGTLIEASADSDGFYTQCQEGSGTLEVIDTSEYTSTGNITVTIH